MRYSEFGGSDRAKKNPELKRSEMKQKEGVKMCVLSLFFLLIHDETSQYPNTHRPKLTHSLTHLSSTYTSLYISGI